MKVVFLMMSFGVIAYCWGHLLLESGMGIYQNWNAYATGALINQTDTQGECLL